MIRAPDNGWLELLTGPSTEPVTRDEAKLHARVETTADDAYIDGLITGARQMVEKLTRRALITQTWTLILDAWPGTVRDDWWDGVREGPISMADHADEVEIRKAPFLAITSVKTIAEDATETTWDSSNYYVAKRAGFGRLVKKSSVVWPSLALPVRQKAGILITFTCGYGANASDVPIALRQAIKDIVAHWYENRGDDTKEVPMTAMRILQQYTVGRAA